MSVDLTKLAFHSGYPAFKNNREYTGTLTISGTTSGGANVQSFTVPLDQEPDLLDVQFNGPTDTVFSQDPRPSDGWFKNGSIWVRTNNAGGGDPSRFQISAEVSGRTLTIKATCLNTFTTSENLTSTDFSYKIVDYSVF